VLVVILTQADKLLLSHLLELRQFGYYSLAASLAAAVAYLTLPVFQAVFPRLSGLVALDDEAATAVLYHRASQAVAVLVIPVASVLAVFSFQVIFVWTGNPTTAGNADTVTTLLVVGGLLNALVNVPYALQLAHGWTRLPLTVNAVAVVIFVPLLVVLGKRYGGVGAAALWVAVNAAYLLVSVSVMHRRLLPREKWRWYLRDVLVPVAGAGAVVGAARLVWPATDSRALTALLLAIVLALAAAVVVALTPYASERARSLLRRQALAKSPAGADLGSDSSVRSQRSRERSVQSR
jgi:O-antigen/teichoic acid export membrane protein